jgi:hypothetical protein
MKKLIFLIFAFTIVNSAFSQVKNKLIGKWQAESAEVTSMYFDSYQFSKNGQFVFKPNEYDGLNRIISINGTYRLKGDTLYLTPLFTEEIVGGNLIRSESTTLSDTWEIVGGKERKFILTKKSRQAATMKLSEDNKILLLDDRKFFKINPPG